MKIQHLNREDIDTLKWDSCVHYANNGNVFAYKWFLDQVSKDWDVLIENDYESVFPLLWKSEGKAKRSLHHPELLGPLGLFSVNSLSPKRTRMFLEEATERFEGGFLLLNEQNLPPGGLPFTVTSKTNYWLDLNNSADILLDRFSDFVNSQITLANSNNLRVTGNLKPEQIASFYQTYGKSPNLNYNFHALQRIMYNALHRGLGFATGVLDASGQLCAAAFFIYSHRRLIKIISEVSPFGVQQGAMACLYNVLVQSNIGRPLLLDFNTLVEDEWAIGLGAQGRTVYEIAL